MPAYAAELLGYVATACTLVVVATFYVSWRATRLDRLHARVDTARAALDAALVRRSAVVADLAASGLLDPATSLLLGEAAREARACGQGTHAPGEADGAGVHGDRELAEGDLSRALRAAVDQPGFRTAVSAHPGGAGMLLDLDASAAKVMLARRFYNDAVRDTRAVRRRRLTRTFRLAGHAPVPAFFEIDDVPPAVPEDATELPGEDAASRPLPDEGS